MNNSHAFNYSADDTPKIDELIELWFLSENQRCVSGNDFEEDSKLEPIRDAATDEQMRIARALLSSPATKLSHILDKLRMWESAYGPCNTETLEEGFDIYNLMVVSAMNDLRLLNSLI